MNASSPKVSVILPTYNRATTVERAVLSVLGQSERDLELIVVDDGSTDGTSMLLATISNPRLRVLRQDNRGPAAARNAGIRAARGVLIGFQDSDDEWLPTKLALQLALLERSGPEVGWIGGQQLTYGAAQAQRIETGLPLDVADIAAVEQQLLAGAPWVTPLWLVRRELLFDAGLFDESLPCLEDWDLLLKLSQRCRFRAVDEVVLVRFGQADSVFGDFSRRKAGLSALLQRHRQRWLTQPALYARWSAALGRLHVLAGEREQGRRWLAEAWRADRSQLRSAALCAATWLPRPLMRRLSWSPLAPSL